MIIDGSDMNEKEAKDWERIGSSWPRIGRRRWWPSGGITWRRRGFSFTTSYTAVNGSSSRQEGSSQKGCSTGGAAKTNLSRVPVLTLVWHLSLIDPDWLSATVTVFSERGIKAMETIGPTLPHHIPLTAKLKELSVSFTAQYFPIMFRTVLR